MSKSDLKIFLIADSPFKYSSKSFKSNIHLSFQNEAEYGIIESIELKNFMCHGSLFFQFGPNVNFIVGKNGSKFKFLFTLYAISFRINISTSC